MNLHEQRTPFIDRPVNCRKKDSLRGRFRPGETIGLVIVALCFSVDYVRRWFFTEDVKGNRHGIGS